MRSLGRLSLVIGLVPAIGIASGCDDGFSPPSYLDNLRVLALVADPPEIGPGETARLTPHLFVPDGEQVVAQSWSFCPFSLGAATGFSCAVEACQVSLEPGDDSSVQVNPLALTSSCASRLGQVGAALPDLRQIPTEIPEQLEVTVGYSVRTAGGFSREAVARIPFWTRMAPQRRNRLPVIQRIEVEGISVAEGEEAPAARPEEVRSIRVLVDPASMDRFIDEAGRERLEEPIISFYATAGRFEDDLGAGLDLSVPWRAEQLEPGQRVAELYVVVRDLRGGQAVAGPIAIPILR
jgi:hypothetical protein